MDGPVVSVPAGATVNLGPLSTTVTGQTAGAEVTGIVNILETNAAGTFIVTVASHGFSVLISAPPGQLEAVGDPSIT